MDVFNKDLYAVITGASQGLGKSFAEELCSRKQNVILISLPDQGLPLFADLLSKKHGVNVHYFETDLSVSSKVKELTDWLNDNFNVHFLINNAGVGGSKKLSSVSLNYIETIIQVNVIATTFLIHQLLPNLMKQDESYILNVSSMAAFTPLGYKTVYPATKIYIDSFSRGLSEETKDSNITISVVHPGAMNTNEDIKRRITKQGFLAKLTLLEPEKVAQHCVNQLLKKKSLIIVNPISWFMSKIIPQSIMIPLMTRTIKREIEQ